MGPILCADCDQPYPCPCVEPRPLTVTPPEDRVTGVCLLGGNRLNPPHEDGDDAEPTPA